MKQSHLILGIVVIIAAVYFYNRYVQQQIGAQSSAYNALNNND